MVDEVEGLLEVKKNSSDSSPVSASTLLADRCFIFINRAMFGKAENWNVEATNEADSAEAIET